MSDPVSRRRFLEAAAALAGVSLIGCSSNSAPPDSGPAAPAPSGGSGPKASSNADGSLSLTGFGTLAVGQGTTFALPDGGPAILFKDAKGNYGAVSALCTHAGCTVQWRGEGAAPLVCPCHNSSFTSAGVPTSGPAKRPLQLYKVQVTGETAKLTAA